VLIATQKKDLRKQLRTQRSVVDAALRQDAARSYIESFFKHITLDTSSKLSLYYPTAHEPDTVPLLNACRQRTITPLLPVIAEDEKSLIFREYYGEASLVLHPRYLIQEPDDYCKEGIPNIMIIPLLGFDRAGFRLGMGSGYYDRTIEKLKASNASLMTIGLAYAFQEVENLPIEPHDQPLDWIFTEHEAIACKRG
jgi:5-formyltetrahydrofolate cyclo-ligase